MNAVGLPGLTQLLLEWRGGDETALERLMPLVYADLRSIARRCLRDEKRGEALETTELVNEAYLRLVRSSQVQWRDRAHFFAMAARLMRRVLVDEVRKRRFQKRGGDLVRVTLDDESASSTPTPDFNLLALDEAIERLAQFSPRKARVVEMRFFGGMTIEETAAALDVSIDVVKREWRTAKLWLLRALREAGDGSDALESD
jgi:RNA polymerase sigma factor (TIGR02999 family)